MNFYSFDEIAEVGDCRAYAEEVLGYSFRGDRCAALWRGGTNPNSVAMNKDGYYDHSRKEGGGIIDLVAVVQFGGDKQLAQDELGRHYGLEPKMVSRRLSSSRYDELLADGYVEVSRHVYKDLDGTPRHIAVKLSHPTHGKEFLQARGDGSWGVSGVELVLYNLPAVAASEYVMVVEGEKDADRLTALMTLPNWAVTTNVGGAGKWADSYSEVLTGKEVILLADNDDAGQSHVAMMAASLAGKAASIRIVTPSKQPKGDVSDYLDSEGSIQELAAMIGAAPVVDPADLPKIAGGEGLLAAIRANKRPLRNYTPKLIEDEEGKKRRVKEPRNIMDLIQDLHTRFLGFPRAVGNEMFDHDRDNGQIRLIRRSTDLFGWIGRKSGHNPDWVRGDAMVNKEEFFSGVLAEATRYESISSVPDWPIRSDVYYTYGELPAPCPEHSRLQQFVDFFSPATVWDRVLVMALIVSPIYYQRGYPRPMWIIDSADGAGVGKTTLVELVAELYDRAPITVGRYQLRDEAALKKRLVSASGRKARVFLVDNVTGSFASEELSRMVTATDISGMAPYGHGEESRPNNLTYVLTANSAQPDDDISIRSIHVMLKRSAKSSSWKSDVVRFLENNRGEVFADIIHLMQTWRPFPDVRPSTRFPEWETHVLQPCCGNMDVYSDVIKLIFDRRADHNMEEELAKVIEEELRSSIGDVNFRQAVHPDRQPIFIHSGVVEEWMRDVFASRRLSDPIQTIRNMCKNGYLTCVDKEITRYPANKKERRRGVMWLPEGDEARKESPIIIGKKGGQFFVSGNYGTNDVEI